MGAVARDRFAGTEGRGHCPGKDSFPRGGYCDCGTTKKTFQGR